MRDSFSGVPTPADVWSYTKPGDRPALHVGQSWGDERNLQPAPLPEQGKNKAIVPAASTWGCSWAEFIGRKP